MRRFLPIAAVVVAIVGVGVGVARFLATINRAVDARTGPVHRFPFSAGETSLTDGRAAAVAREVMTRDGFAEPGWKLLDDGGADAPEGFAGQSLEGNATHPTERSVTFFCANSPTPTRYVHVELRNGEIAARGTLGK